MSALPVEAQNGIDLSEWPESTKAIRAQVPTLNDKNLRLIFSKARQVQPSAITDAELAAATRSDEGRALRATEKYSRHPVIWGYELVCLALERRRRRSPVPTCPDGPHYEDSEDPPPIEPTGKVRLGKRCPVHRVRVVWRAADGSVACVYCTPPGDPIVKAEARQMIEQTTEAHRPAP